MIKIVLFTFVLLTESETFCFLRPGGNFCSNCFYFTFPVRLWCSRSNLLQVRAAHNTHTLTNTLLHRDMKAATSVSSNSPPTRPPQQYRCVCVCGPPTLQIKHNSHDLPSLSLVIFSLARPLSCHVCCILMCVCVYVLKCFVRVNICVSTCV